VAAAGPSSMVIGRSALERTKDDTYVLQAGIKAGEKAVPLAIHFEVSGPQHLFPVPLGAAVVKL
jgi:hypothetical protein